MDSYVLDWMEKHLAGCFWTDLSTGLTSLSVKRCSCAWGRCLPFHFLFPCPVCDVSWWALLSLFFLFLRLIRSYLHCSPLFKAQRFMFLVPL